MDDQEKVRPRVGPTDAAGVLPGGAKRWADEFDDEEEDEVELEVAAPPARAAPEESRCMAQRGRNLQRGHSRGYGRSDQNLSDIWDARRIGHDARTQGRTDSLAVAGEPVRRQGSGPLERAGSLRDADGPRRDVPSRADGGVHRPRVAISAFVRELATETPTATRPSAIFGSGRPRDEVAVVEASRRPSGEGVGDPERRLSSVSSVSVVSSSSSRPLPPPQQKSMDQPRRRIDPFGGAKPQNIFEVEAKKAREREERQQSERERQQHRAESSQPSRQPVSLPPKSIITKPVITPAPLPAVSLPKDSGLEPRESRLPSGLQEREQFSQSVDQELMCETPAVPPHAEVVESIRRPSMEDFSLQVASEPAVIIEKIRTVREVEKLIEVPVVQEVPIVGQGTHSTMSAMPIPNMAPYAYYPDASGGVQLDPSYAERQLMYQQALYPTFAQFSVGGGIPYCDPSYGWKQESMVFAGPAVYSSQYGPSAAAYVHHGYSIYDGVPAPFTGDTPFAGDVRFSAGKPAVISTEYHTVASSQVEESRHEAAEPAISAATPHPPVPEQKDAAQWSPTPSQPSDRLHDTRLQGSGVPVSAPSPQPTVHPSGGNTESRARTRRMRVENKPMQEGIPQGPPVSADTAVPSRDRRQDHNVVLIGESPEWTPQPPPPPPSVQPPPPENLQEQQRYSRGGMQRSRGFRGGGSARGRPRGPIHEEHVPPAPAVQMEERMPAGGRGSGESRHNGQARGRGRGYRRGGYGRRPSGTWEYSRQDSRPTYVARRDSTVQWQPTTTADGTPGGHSSESAPLPRGETQEFREGQSQPSAAPDVRPQVPSSAPMGGGRGRDFRQYRDVRQPRERQSEQPARQASIQSQQLPESPSESRPDSAPVVTGLPRQGSGPQAHHGRHENQNSIRGRGGNRGMRRGGGGGSGSGLSRLGSSTTPQSEGGQQSSGPGGTLRRPHREQQTPQTRPSTRSDLHPSAACTPRAPGGVTVSNRYDALVSSDRDDED